MQPFKNLIPALLLGNVINPRNPLLASRQRLRFLFAQEVFFFAETVEAASVSVVGGGGGGWAQEEGFLFDSFGEELGGCFGGVGAGEEVVGDVGWCWC